MTEEQGQAVPAPTSRDIAAALRSEIQSGKPPAGEQLPTAPELAATHGVGRTTVHRAFAILEGEGLVDIRPGKGVFVRSWKPILRDANKRLSRGQWGEGKSVWAADLEGRPMTVELSTYTTADVPTEVRERLDVPAYFVRDRLYRVEKQPVQLAKSYFDAGTVQGTAIAEPDTGTGGTFQRLADLGLRPDEFVEDLRVRDPSGNEAERLRIGVDRKVIEVLRENATQGGRVVEVTHMVLVADAYVLRYHMTS